MRSPFIAALAAGSLMITAGAAGARQPGPAPARGGAEVESSDELVGGMFAIIGLIVVLVLVGVLVIFDDDDEDVPTSP